MMTRIKTYQASICARVLMSLSVCRWWMKDTATTTPPPKKMKKKLLVGVGSARLSAGGHPASPRSKARAHPHEACPTYISTTLTHKYKDG